MMTGLLGGLDPHTWDRLAGSHFYSSSRWLRLCDATPGPRRGAVVVRSGSEIGAVPVAEVESAPSPNYDWDRVLLRRTLPALGSAGLLVGPTLAYQGSLLTSGAAMTQPLLAAVRERAAGRPCVLMYAGTADVLALREAGVAAPPVLLEPEAWFEVADSWEGWLASLSQRARYRVRRDVRRFDALPYKVFHEALPAVQDRLVPLAVELAKKLGYDASPARFQAEFGSYAEYTGDVARVALCENADGTLMSFCIYYVCGDTVFLRWSASNYPRLPGDGAEYFNVGYYSQVHVAVEAGARWLHAGKAAIGAKVLRGARLRPLWMVDLSIDSPLRAVADDIRAGNAAMLRDLLSDPLTANSLHDRAEWEPFC